MEETSAVITMDCEEAICNEKKPSTAELNKEAEINSLIKVEELFTENIMECEEVTSRSEDSTSLNELKEDVKRSSTTQMKEVVGTLRTEEVMEIIDEPMASSADQPVQNSTEKQTEASSDSVEANTLEEVASPNLISTNDSDIITGTQPTEAEVDAPTTAQTVVSPSAASKIDSEGKEDSSSNLPPDESCPTDQAKSQAPLQKTSKIIKTIPIGKTTAAPGKHLNIKILSKDEKVIKSATVSTSGSSQTPMKYVSAPITKNSLALKKPPIILPKPPPLSISTSTAAAVSSSSSTSSQPSTLHKVLVPKNYVLVQTSTGLSFALADQVQNGTIKTSSSQNVSILKTANSSSVSIVNAPIMGKAIRPKTSVSQQIKASIQKPSSSATKVNLISSSFRADPVSSSSPISASSVNTISSLGTTFQPAKLSMTSNTINIGPAHDHTEAKKIFLGECQHPTCCTYRDKVLEELRLKLKNRTRKIKSTRTAKERCVKRAAAQMIVMKNLQRQRAVLRSLESFPDGLCQTLMRAQLKPNEGVRAKRQYEKQLKAFATQLHTISPQAYDYVRSVFNKVLPESKAINSWNFSGAEDVVAESVDETRKTASTDEEEETEGDESDGDEEMLEEDDEEEL